MSEKLSALVTAGGTREPIDDVRYITNFSTGKFGYTIGRKLADVGFQVTVICPQETPFIAGGAIEGVTHLPLTDTASLQQTLMEQRPPDIVFHAAAVSDYKPTERVIGKMRSNESKRIIELERTPKILAGLREHYGVETFIVGFKLLSNVSRPELVAAALEQTKSNRLNLTIANDLRDLHDGRQPVILVTAEGGSINLGGTREEVAACVVEFVRKRMDVDWYHTQQCHDLPIPSEQDMADFGRLLNFAQTSHLLYDSSGNISMRLGDSMIVTPRQVDKSTVAVSDAVVAHVDHDTLTVSYQGNKKSSIDTAVADAVYLGVPHIKYLLHFHTPWGAADHKTTFPYPCGAREEGEEILNRLPDKETSKNFSVELIHHGFLLGLQDADIIRLEEEWQASVAEFQWHLNEVGLSAVYDESLLRPVLSGTKVIGVVQEHPRGVTPYVRESERGRIGGRKLIGQLIQRQACILAADECEVVNYYRRFGFTPEKDPETGINILYPPPLKETDELFDHIEDWKLT